MSDRETNDDWIVELHEAIVASDDPNVVDALTAPADDPFAERVRDCLIQLEQRRRQIQWGLESGKSAAELLGLSTAHALSETRIESSGLNWLTGKFENCRVGRFEIVREIGRGGHGIVFLARDPQLGRQIALKIPHPNVLLSASLRRRFIREGEAAARLRHPNVLTVYEAGEAGPTVYLAQAYCRGANLATWLRDQKGPVAPRLAAQLVAQLARGVEHAHAHGILHRDLKPSNVLLEPDIGGADEELPFVPQLADFGLARFLEDEQQLTQTGALVGTASYMAPEQATGAHEKVGRATDVYGLGAILYELITGVPPYAGANQAETLQKLLSQTLVTPRHLRSDTPRDLEAICLKCLESQPARRYATAADLETDLKRYLEGLPTIARPLGNVAHVVRWARRKPSLAVASAIVFLAIVGTAAAGWWTSLVRARALRDANALLYAADLQLAQHETENDQQQIAVERLARSRGTELSRDSFVWSYLWNTNHQELRTYTGHEGAVYTVDYAPDGNQLASGGADRTVRIWDAHSPHCQRVLRGHTAEVNEVRFAPVGDVLASGSDDGTVRIWNSQTGALVREVVPPHVPKARIAAMAYSPQGNLLAVACGHHTLIFNTSDWSVKAKLPEQTKDVESIAFSWDGKWLANGGGERVVRLWDANTFQLQYEYQGPSQSAIARLRFDPAGRFIVCLYRNEPRVHYVDTATGHAGEVNIYHVDWTNDFLPLESFQFIIASKDGTIRRQNPEGTRVERRMNSHQGTVWSLAMSPDHREFASASGDGTLKIWSTADPTHEVRTLAAWTEIAGFVGQSHRLVYCSESSPFNQIDLATHALPRPLSMELQLSGDFDGDGKQDRVTFQAGHWHIILATGTSEDRQLGQFGDVPIVGDFDGDKRSDIGVMGPHEWQLELSSQGHATYPITTFPDWLIPLVGDWNGDGKTDLGLYHQGEWALFDRLPPAEPAQRFHMGDHRTLPVTGDWDGDGKDDCALLDEHDALQLDLDHHGEPAEAVVEHPFRPPSSLIARLVGGGASAATPSSSYHLPSPNQLETDFDRRPWKDDVFALVGILKGHAFLAFAGTQHDHRVRLWWLNSGHLFRTFAFEDPIRALGVAQDKPYLAIAAGDRVEIRNVSTEETVRTFTGVASSYVKLSNSGRLLALVQPEGNFRLFEVTSGELLSDPFTGEVGASVAFSANDELIAVPQQKVVQVYNRNDHATKTLVGHEHRVTSVCFFPNGSEIAARAEDGVVRIWDLRTGQELIHLRTITDSPTPLYISNDGRCMIAASGAEPTVDVWSIPQSAQP